MHNTLNELAIKLQIPLKDIRYLANVLIHEGILVKEGTVKSNPNNIKGEYVYSMDVDKFLEFTHNLLVAFGRT